MSAKDSSKPSCSHTHRFTDMWSKRHLHWSFMAPRRRHHLFQRLSPFKRSTSPRSGGSSPSHWAECRGREVEETPRPFRGTDHTVTGVVGGLRQLFPGIQRDGGKPPVHPHESGNTQMFSFFLEGKSRRTCVKTNIQVVEASWTSEIWDINVRFAFLRKEGRRPIRNR